MPTPAVAYLAGALDFDLGVVLSASHNPYADNGIKVFSGRGEKFGEAEERAVEAVMADASLVRGRRRAGSRVHAPISSTPISITSRRLLPHAGRSRASRLAVDMANGATTTTAARMFERLGFDGRAARRRAERPQHQPRLRIDASGASATPSSRSGAVSAWRSTATATARSSSTIAAASSTATPCC